MKRISVLFFLLAILLTAAAIYKPVILHVIGTGEYEQIEPSCAAWCSAHRYHAGDALIGTPCDCKDEWRSSIILPYISTNPPSDCAWPICLP